MQESCEMHSEEDKVLPEHNKKRRLKTPSQVEALETFYNEHKYPTELMKSQVAEKLGLSEKQISGWFCHRRLKDKKLLKDEACANGRQDRSSVVIQDRGSGQRQDSCSSTKQGDNMHFDPKEVESRRLYGQNYPAAGLIYENRGHYNRNSSAVDNTSSGSSSASQDRLFPQFENSYDMESSRFLSQNDNSKSRTGNYKLMNTKTIKNRGYMMPSGYLNVQDETENIAITAVKRQLGRHYWEDGPPLGVEFQELPPGAFDSAISDPMHEPYYVGDPTLLNSQTVPGVCMEPNLSTRHDIYSCKMRPQDSYHEGTHFRKTMRESDRREKCSNYPSMRKTSFTNYSKPVLDGNSAMDMDEDSAGEASVFNSNRNYGMRTKHGIGGMRLDSVTDHRLRPYDGKSKLSNSWLHKYDDASPSAFQRKECLEAVPSNLILQHSESLGTEDRGQSSRMTKIPVEKLCRERRTSNEYNPVQVKMHPANEMRLGKRERGEFLRRDYVSETPSPQELLPWTNQIKGSAAEMPTSFSDDETAETSSSMD